MTQNKRQKGRLAETVHKELRVVGSRNRSPLPLRVAKWVLFLAITRRLYATRWFWHGFSVFRSQGWPCICSTGTRRKAGRNPGAAGETWRRLGRRRLRE
jgi:hypothetical protein